MKRCVVVVALLSLALTAPAAGAADLVPATGSWKGESDQSSEAVSFKLQKIGDDYRAASTRVYLVAPCAAGNPNAGTAVRAIRARRVTVRLRAVGNQLRGTRTLTRSADRGKATYTLKVAMRFVSKRRAKVRVNVRYATKRKRDGSNADRCSGRLALGAAPSVARTVTVGGKGGGRAVTIKRGDTLKVRLTDTPSTGFSWKLSTRPTASVLDGRGSKVQPGPTRDEDGNPIVGSPGQITFTWRATGRGKTRIVLNNVPPGRQKGGSSVRYTVTVR